jgi:hypothetical protein
MILPSREWYKLIIILYELLLSFSRNLKTKVFHLQIRGIRVQILQWIGVWYEYLIRYAQKVPMNILFFLNKNILVKMKYINR